MARQPTHPRQAARIIIILAAALLEAGCAVSAGPAHPDASAVPAASPAGTRACTEGDSDVPTFRGDAARTGRMPGSLPLTKPTIAWQLEAGGPLHTSPAVAAGTVFQTTATGSLLAVDLATGATRWRADLDGALTSPTVIDDLVVVGSTTGWLKALQRETGSVRWTVESAGQVRAAPAPFGDGFITGSTSGQVTSARVANGAVDWTVDVAGAVTRSTAIADGTVVVPVEPGSMVALDARSGHELWHTSIAQHGGVGTPTIDSGRVFTASGLGGAPAADRGIVAVDLETGTQLWRWASPTGDRTYTPAMRDRGAFVVSEAGFAVALDPTTGREMWRTDVTGPAEANAVVTGDTVGIADDGGTVSALDAIDGRIRWQVPIVGVPAAPVVTCGFVLVATELGTLTAFSTPS
jgi:eukaryotic-like serine/threonine-protein kinase